MRNIYKYVHTRIFSPAAYLKFISNPANKRAIQNVKFIPPKLGSSNFGKIYVEYKYLTDSLLAPLGFTLGSPRDSARRGSHISIRHEEGYRINRALIDEMNVIPDFREPDNIRLGFAPLYISFTDVWEGFDRIKKVVDEKRYEKYPKQRLVVT